MSNIVVLFKYTYDPDEIRIDPNTRKPIYEGVNKKINEFDKNALEEALRLKEILGGKIIAVTFSNDPEISKGALEALSRGADEAYVIKSPMAGSGNPYITAYVISSFVKNMLKDFSIILAGSVSVDNGTGLVPLLIAKSLDIPVVSYVTKIEEIGDSSITVQRRMGNVIEKLELQLPAVIGVEMEINEPRIPKLKDILAAKKKPVYELPIEQIGINEDQLKSLGFVETLETYAPEIKRKRIKVEDKPVEEMAKEFVETLKKEGII